MGRSNGGARALPPRCKYVSQGVTLSSRTPLRVVIQLLELRRLSRFALWLICVGVIAGCGDKKADTGLVPVKGELFYDSQPAQGAFVILHPSAGPDAAKWPHGLPHGVVGSDGAYKIGLPPVGEGAPAGDYKVLLTWNVPIPTADPSDSEPETFDKLGGRWATPDKSTLSASIQPPSTDIPRFELKSR